MGFGMIALEKQRSEKAIQEIKDISNQILLEIK